MQYRSIINDFEAWRLSAQRKPMILRGARQVGKTTAVRAFAKQSFSCFVEINLEDAGVRRHFKDELSLDQFLTLVRQVFDVDLRGAGSDALVFIDEVQECPWLLELLRFFYEDLPELCVIASGSLLEVKLQALDISIPVGRVQNYYLQPLDFFEFLEFCNERKLLQLLKELDWKTPLPASLHQDALKLFYQYTIVGGMPEVVAAFSRGASSSDLETIKHDLLTTYQDDVLKYASGDSKQHLEHVIANAPRYAGSMFHFKKFADSAYSSKNMQQAFYLLEKAMILYLSEVSDKPRLPIITQKKRRRKLVFLDCGLVSQAFGLSLDSPEFSDLNSIYRGQVAEQVVGQQLLVKSSTARERLCYWAKLSTAGEAEVDFILEQSGRLLAVEVKSGSSGKLRSLLSLASSNSEALLVRVYAGEMSKESVRGELIHSLPFYLLPRMRELLK